MRKIPATILLLLPFSVFSQIHFDVGAGYVSGFHNVTEQSGDETDVGFYGTGYEIGGLLSYSSDNNFFSPHIGYAIRVAGTNTEYTIGSDALSYTLAESNRFTSHDFYLGNSVETGRFRFGLSAGVSFYSWSSTKTSSHFQANQTTQYILQQYTRESMRNTEPGYLIFIQPEVSYTLHKRWSIYSQVVIPVWNTEKELHIKSELQDDWNDFTHETDISFQTFMWSVGVRLLIWEK